MSTTDDVFLETGLPLDGAARGVADALGMGLYPHASGDFVLSSEGFAGLPGLTKAQLYGNIYSATDLYPDEAAAYDGTDAVLKVWRPDKDLAAQLSGARHAMHLLVERFGWRAVLVHNMGLLVATWDPVSGWREYPPGITPDIEHRDVWAIRP